MIEEQTGATGPETGPAEAPEAAAAEAPEAAARRHVPLAAEALGYAGGGLALAALVTLVTMYWDALGSWGRVGISAAVALAGLAGGWAVDRVGSPAAKRLASFLLALGVTGAGCAVGFLTHQSALRTFGLPASGSGKNAGASEWAWFAGTFTIAVTGGLVWTRRRTWIQHLAFGLGVGTAALLVLPLVPIDGPDWGPGAVLALVGVVWGALAYRGALEPENAGLLLGTLGVLGGIALMSFAGDAGPAVAWAVWLGLGASLALVALGAWTRRFVVLGTAVAGLFAFTVQLVSSVLEIGMGMPIFLLGLGGALLAAATVDSVRREGDAEDARSILVEIGGYAGGAFLFAGTASLLGEFWESLSEATRIAVPAAASGVAYVSGAFIGRSARRSARRLSQALVAGGAAGAGVTVGMVARLVALRAFGPVRMMTEYEPMRDPDAWAQVTGGAGAIAAAALTWWRKPGPAVVVVAGAACYMTAGSATGFLQPGPPPYWLPGGPLLVLGVAAVVLGVLERLRPSGWVIGTGSTIAIFAAMMMTRDGEGHPVAWPLWFGLALAVAAIVVSIRLRRGVLLGFGAAGVVALAVTLVTTLFEGDIAGPIALLVAGVTFIGMAVLVGVLLPRFRAKPPAEEGPSAS